MKQEVSAKRIQNILLAAIIVLLVGCSAYVEPGKTVLAPTPFAVSYRVDKHVSRLQSMPLDDTIPVYICCSRNVVGWRQKKVHPYGNQRSKQLVPSLALAQVSMSHPKGGEYVRYETLNKVKNKKTRIKMVGLKMFARPIVTPMTSDQEKKHQFLINPWLRDIHRQLDKNGVREITVFVHGYNTHLVGNTELLAEIYHYAGRRGVVVNYEWPSAGRLLGYIQDKGNAEHSTRMFRSFISRIAYFTGAEKIRIIAHSAGNPIVVNALKELRLMNKDLTPEQLHKKYKISQVVLAAPDMDLMRFINSIMDHFYEMAPTVVIYISPSDRALKLASKLFGQSRLGNSIGKLNKWERVELSMAKNVQMIDVSTAQRLYGTLLGHGYFHHDPWVSSDLILSMSRPNPADRGLVKQPGDIFWHFPKDYPQRLQKLK